MTLFNHSKKGSGECSSFRSSAQEDDSSQICCSLRLFGCDFGRFFLILAPVFEQYDFRGSEEIFMAVGNCGGGGGVCADHPHLRSRH